jgi:protein tyrosine/serine phosphatase
MANNIMQNIAKIEKNLFLGSLFSIAPETLQENNITYIFHFGFEIPKHILDNDYFCKSCKHEYFDLEDDSQSVNKMLKISDYVINKIHELINTETILVCCVAGKSRSASMIALYLHHKYPELSYEEIINDRINKFRSISINQTFTEAIIKKINNK